jgi:hypothetical protein
MARPKKEIDYNAVEKLASIQCTQEEIANFLDVSVRTLQRDEEFCQAYNKGKENGKMSLRRTQFKLAEKSYAMAIWLGKQYLGQRDVPEQVEKSENGILQELVEAIRDDKSTKRDTES